MIKSLLLCAVLVGAASYPVYVFLQPPEYGVSPVHPIGEFAKIEAFIQRWQHYKRTTGTVSEDLAYEFGKQFEGLNRYDYSWKDLRPNGYPRVITVVVDGAELVQAIRAQFPSKTQEPREPALRSEELMWRLWGKLAAREPRFTRVRGTEGILHVDSFATRGVGGTWIKSYRVPARERSICDTVVICRTPADGGAALPNPMGR